MERISVFDIFKVGIGPSSSHTMGPWKAALQVIDWLNSEQYFHEVISIHVTLFGSLAKTGIGHGTDIAIMLGLSGEDPQTIPVESIREKIDQIKHSGILNLNGENTIAFNPETNLIFDGNTFLPFHPNGMTFSISLLNGQQLTQTYYSIGGGFIIRENEKTNLSKDIQLTCPIDEADDLLKWTREHHAPIHQIVFENEKAWRSGNEVHKDLLHIWEVMKSSILKGCFTEGILPGGLNVKRRAPGLIKELAKDLSIDYENNLVSYLQSNSLSFPEILTCVSSFALAVNEENASFGRVVTAPTNGASGIIPAVLMYYYCFVPNADESGIIKFLLTAGEIGSIFKKGSTLSAAMGGCQAEIGVSSAMAAAALTECTGGSPEQAIMAAEIAMEHHLGLTCDPIGGLVQVPCIERNTMGAVKAITASQLALHSKPDEAKVSLDGVIKTMWETALDMNSKYKETSDGGLAVNIPVNLPDC